MLFKAAIVAMLLAHSFALAQAPGGAPAGGAQDNKDQGTMYFNVHAGRMLPYDIYGVRNIIPYWGLRFGHTFGDAGLEWTIHHTIGKGVTYYDGSVSFAFPSELEGWKFIPFIGLHTHYFKGTTTSGELPWSTSMGFHLGVSPLFDFSKNFAFRADFKFNYNPGKSLHVGGGFQYYF